MITYRKHAVRSSSSSLGTSFTQTQRGVPANSATAQHIPANAAAPVAPTATSPCCHGPCPNCHCKSFQELRVTAGSSRRILRLTGLVQAACVQLGHCSFPKRGSDRACWGKVLSAACPDLSDLTLSWEKQAQPRWQAALTGRPGLSGKALSGGSSASHPQAWEAGTAGLPTPARTPWVPGYSVAFWQPKLPPSFWRTPTSGKKESTFVLAFEVKVPHEP